MLVPMPISRTMRFKAKGGSSSGFIVGGKAAQCRLITAVAQPVADRAEAEPLIEAPRRVPPDDLEIDAAPAALDRDRREARHQPAADAVSARRLADVEVFEIEARPPQPGR